MYTELSYEYDLFKRQDPRLTTVDDLLWRKDWTWTGDPRLVEDWTELGMMRGHRVPDTNLIETVTAEELMEMRRFLNLPGDQVHGLVRVLRIGGIEHEEIMYEREFSEGEGPRAQWASATR